MKISMPRWKRFQRDKPEAAREIRELALAACELLTGKRPEEQIELYERECAQLRSLLGKHGEPLVLSTDSGVQVAWVLTMCLCAVMRSENART